MTNVLPVDLPDAVIEQLGEELDAIYDATIASLGSEDERYIRRLIRTQRTLALGSRLVMLVGAAVRPRGVLGRRVGPSAHRVGAALLTAGAAGLGLAKILENMEIGHNVMHGQWDWMN